VHLVIPERPLFSRDKADATASIVLKVRGALEPQQVRAIRHLVATAVNGLRPERVSIVDEQGQLLADGAGNDPNGGDVSSDERQAVYEKRVRSQVEAIVSSVVGPGHSRVQIAADFDFNRVTQTSDKFDPDSKVVRSSQTREETSATGDGRDNQVTVGNEIPGGGQRPNAAAGARGDESRKTEEVVNYEISKTTKTEVIEGGRLNRISVAVLVDGNYVKNDKGEVTYQPRGKEEIDQISALVRSAIGFDQKRGDQVEVVNLRFAETPAAPITEPTGWLSAFQFTKDDIMRAIEMVVMGLLGLVVMLMVVRPLVRRVLAPDEGAKPALPRGGLIAGGADGSGGGSSLPGNASAGRPAAISSSDPVASLESSQASKMIDLAQVKGQVHAQSVQRVGEMADKNPQETVSIIRQWLHESAAA